MNKKKFALLNIILVLATLIPIARASFSDVSTANKYYTAIQYLKINNVINGYPDGTFKPEQNVTRVELLKILIAGINIPLDVSTKTGFSDVDENAWYAPYVRKAKQQGWVIGYADNTFKPGQYVSKAEAIKIIALANQWQIPSSITITTLPYIDTPATAWFTPYILAAKQRNFLEETGRIYVPDAAMNRGQVSEVLFRIKLTAANKADIYNISFTYNLNLKDETINMVGPNTLSAADLARITYSTFEPTFFNGVTLKSNFPNTYFLNEVYYFEGTINSGSYKQIFAFTAPVGQTDTSTYTNYLGEISGNKFKIPVIFRSSGNFRIGIILGESGESKVANITVLNGLPQAPSVGNSTTTPAPAISYHNFKTTLIWPATSSNLQKLTISQSANSKYFIFRQNTNSFDLDYKDFATFKNGESQYKLETSSTSATKPFEITSGWSTGSIKTFNAVNHTYANLDPTAITVMNLPETQNTLNAITFNGSNPKNIEADAYIIKPDGNVDVARLHTTATLKDLPSGSVIPAGSTFSFTYTPIIAGTYSIEINDQDGMAVLNTPVYVKNGIPLIANYFDLHENDDPVPYYELSSYRSQLLKLINEERAKMNLKAVILDNPLNNLAQAHSDDMVSRNFFGHVNPDGKTPDDRRIAAGMTTPVGENLANAPDIFFTHYGLMQSAVHRKNILDPKWTKVGIGMAKNTDGYYLTTEEFSSDPLTETDLANMENDILMELNQARSSLNLRPLSKDDTLSGICDTWSQKMATEDFFNFTSPNGGSLSSLINNAKITTSVQAIILEASNKEKLVNEVNNNSEALNSQWTKLGIGLKTNKTGILEATLLFTN